MTTALEGGEGLASRPGRYLPPGKTRYPLYRRLGGPQGRSGQVRKTSPPPGFDPRTVQPVASRYTDYATRPTDCRVKGKGKFVSAHAMKAYVKGNRGIAAFILNLSARWRWAFNVTFRPVFHIEKQARYPLNTRLGWLESRSGLFGKRNYLTPSGIRTKCWEDILQICRSVLRVSFPVQQKSAALLVFLKINLTHWGRVTQICVFTLLLCKTDDANLRF